MPLKSMVRLREVGLQLSGLVHVTHGGAVATILFHKSLNYEE